MSSRVVWRIVIAVVGLGVVALVVYFSTRSSGKAEAAAKDAAPRAVPVVTVTAERRDVPVWLEGLGTVTGVQQVVVRPQVDGRLDQVYFKEGQAVKRGQLLAQIDPRPFQVQLHSAEGALARDRAQLDANTRNLERFRTLRKDNLVAQQQVDDQVALVGQFTGTVQADQAAVESARLNLDYARVQAPIDGVVGIRQVDVGNLIHASDTTGLLVITQLDPAAVTFTVPQDELGGIADAQARGDVPVEAWSRDGKVLLGKGKLVVVDNLINQATSTLKLKALVPNPGKRLWPNQFVKARALLDIKHAALVVPAAAIQRGPQGTFVFVVAADRSANVRPVEVAAIAGDTAIIGKGLDGGETVVTEGQSQLRAGATVSVRSPDGKTTDIRQADGKTPGGKNPGGKNPDGKRPKAPADQATKAGKP